MIDSDPAQYNAKAAWRRRAGSAWVVGVLLLLGGYWVLFFPVRLPSLEARLPPQTPPGSIRRIDLLVQLLLLPEEWLGDAWFGRPRGISLWDRLPVLWWAGVVLAGAWAAGWLVLRALAPPENLSRLERHCFSLAVGANLVSTYTLAVGLAGLLRYRAVFWIPLAGVWAAVGWTNRNYLKYLFSVSFSKFSNYSKSPKPAHNLKYQIPSPQAKHSRLGNAPKDSPPSTANRGSAGWVVAIAPFVAILLLGAMLPPVDFDVREYHLQAPKEWYQQGRIAFLPHNVYANMPLGAEMLGLAAMGVSGQWWLGALAGKTAMASMSLVCAAAIWAIGRRIFSPQAGLTGAALYLATPWIIQVSTAGLNEGVTACYGLLALWALWLWHCQQDSTCQNAIRPSSASSGLATDDLSGDSSQPAKQEICATPGYQGIRANQAEAPSAWSYLILGGYLVGAAAGTKYPAVLFLGLPALGWVGWQARLGRSRKGLPTVRVFLTVGVFLLAGCLGGGLWYLKNACLAGNPVYPLGYSVLGGKAWDWDKETRWNRVHLPGEFSPKRLADDLSRMGWRSEWIGPLIVPLAVLAFWRRFPPGGLESEKAGAFRWFLVGSIAWWLGMWWLGTHRIDRFWLPAMPMAALLAGLGAYWSETFLWRLARLGLLTLGLAYGFLVASAIPAAGGYNRYFVPLERLRIDPERVDPWHLWLNRHVLQGRVLLVGDAQPFDLEMPVLYATCFNTSPLEEILWEAAARTNLPTGQPVSLSGQLPGRSGKPSGEKVPADWLGRPFALAVKQLLMEREIKYIFVHWGEIARYRSPGNYGFTPLVEPELFDALVRWGVLEPLAPLSDHPGRCYRVRP